MKNLHFFIILIYSIFLLTSCASQKYTKKGIQYEQNGLQSEAANCYYIALSKNTDNIEARIGLKRTGQIVLDLLLKKFDEAYSLNNNTLAVEQYQKASQYYQKLNRLNIDLDFPTQYHQYYEDAKNVFLEEKHLKATQLLEDNQFKSAETLFREILSYNNTYRDAAEKLKIAVCEPVYLNIVQLMAQKKYRAAYTNITNLQKKYNYKDIIDLKSECLEQGRVIVVFLPISNSTTTEQNINQIVRNNVMNRLKRLNDPFLKITESTQNLPNGKQIIEFQCATNGLIYNAGRLNSIKTKGWIREKSVDPENNVHYKYKKTYYSISEQSRSLSFVLNIQLTDLKNRSILATRSEKIAANDAIKYAYFEGNGKNLVQGYWKSKINIFDKKSDRIDDNLRSNAELQNLLNSRKVIKDYQTLLNEACDQAIYMAFQNVKNNIDNE